MKDSQLRGGALRVEAKYIKANNERFSTSEKSYSKKDKYIKANNERFSTVMRQMPHTY